MPLTGNDQGSDAQETPATFEKREDGKTVLYTLSPAQVNLLERIAVAVESIARTNARIAEAADGQTLDDDETPDTQQDV